ncbi:type IV toxin-antitoxin system AbiEi family antitoxin domain-containing protein [Nocardioides sp. cx-173]|uniref:type IV toxin-antitoxin system AbiEi family antitoxin domain-containing protein n=1 Tax=Nocardioides sp. cx-173 TaxID=2898796 RepID=UPI001E317CA3|nr:type IV toxin-antitoxin system AbiEi family antitoxin domain-containing protein [Nocardioides sp. cx-173]MCD4524175.1 type IV toxin-antitoxin system AbiEi family antitoxin domain-containing protein [Nocardioides sp. cx-173]UGB41570.1 type IV toxin-antitoxin system AbiEi family antitoxin domain-containing protein [Nocardioides sp. cx-173]
MHPDVLATMARNHGLITRAQALDCGLSPTAITALLREEWVAVRRGVYAERGRWESLDAYRGRPRLQTRAALLHMTRGWVLSHDSAAHEQGLDILTPERAFVHVTRPGHTNAWTKAGVKHHLAGFSPDQLVTVGDLRCLDLARTCCDIARERGVQHGVPAMDSALRRGVSRSDLLVASAPMAYWPGVKAVRASLELADAGAESVAESLGRLLVRELGVGAVETQFPILLEGRTHWCDLRVGRHVFEVDGHLKYRGVHEGGLAVRPDEVVWAEKKRERLIRAEGLGVSRIIWEDYWGERRVLARRRLRADYDVTVARFGTALPPHLEHFAQQMRGRRPA